MERRGRRVSIHGDVIQLHLSLSMWMPGAVFVAECVRDGHRRRGKINCILKVTFSLGYRRWSMHASVEMGPHTLWPRQGKCVSLFVSFSLCVCIALCSWETDIQYTTFNVLCGPWCLEGKENGRERHSECEKRQRGGEGGKEETSTKSSLSILTGWCFPVLELNSSKVECCCSLSLSLFLLANSFQSDPLYSLTLLHSFC